MYNTTSFGRSRKRSRGCTVITVTTITEIIIALEKTKQSSQASDDCLLGVNGDAYDAVVMGFFFIRSNNKNTPCAFLFLFPHCSSNLFIASMMMMMSTYARDSGSGQWIKCTPMNGRL
jgi:hypothetical protein